MRKLFSVVTLTLLGMLMLAAPAFAAAKSYATLPFDVASPDQYKYLSMSVPQMISSRIYWKGHFQPVPKNTLAGKSSASSEKDATSAQASLKADYIIWGSIKVNEELCTLNVYVRGPDKKLWSRSINTKVSQLTGEIQKVSSSISREVFGRKESEDSGATVISAPAPIAERENQLNPNLVHNEDRPKDVYLNPQFRYAGNSGEGSTIRSQSLPFAAVDFDVYDYDGDGKSEVAIMEKHALHIYRFDGATGKLNELASDRVPEMKDLLSLRTYDTGAGHPKIVLNAQDARGEAASLVYVFDGRELKQESKDIPFYLNVVIDPGTRKPMLIGQRSDVQRVFRPGGVHLMQKGSAGTYVEAGKIDLPEGINALNYAWLPAEKEHSELLVGLVKGERLRVYSKAGSRMFETEDSYSGAYVGIEQTNQIWGMGKDRKYLPDQYYIPQRMLAVDLEGRGKYVLLVNKPVSTASQIFERYRFFPQGEIHALYWDGVGLNLLWKTRRIKGSVIDISLGDLNNDGIKDLIVCLNTHPGAVGIESRKTLIIAYPLDLTKTNPDVPVDQSEFIHNDKYQ